MTVVAAATQEFAISREFHAPREKVWKAWTEASQLEKWWGPKGSKIRVYTFDFRPGGMFHYSMEFQPGRPMYGRFVYREIVAPEKIVFVNSFSDAAGGITRAPFPQLGDKWPLEVLNHVTFAEQGGKTTVSLRGGPINASDEEIRMYVGMFDSMRGGFSGTFDQLDAYLSTH